MGTFQRELDCFSADNACPSCGNIPVLRSATPPNARDRRIKDENETRNMNSKKESVGSRVSIGKDYSRIDIINVNPTAIPEGVLDIRDSAKGDDESSDFLSQQERKVSITSPSTTDLPHLTSHKEKSVLVGRKRNKVTFQCFPNPKEKFVAGRSVSLKSYDKAPQKPQRRRSNSIP